jgi:hypothetical protein
MKRKETEFLKHKYTIVFCILVSLVYAQHLYHSYVSLHAVTVATVTCSLWFADLKYVMCVKHMFRLVYGHSALSYNCIMKWDRHIKEVGGFLSGISPGCTSRKILRGRCVRWGGA